MFLGHGTEGARIKDLGSLGLQRTESQYLVVTVANIGIYSVYLPCGYCACNSSTFSLQHSAVNGLGTWIVCVTLAFEGLVLGT